MMNDQERATVLAALRFYQQSGLCDPGQRPDAIHDIATDGDNVISMDAAGIDELCQRLNFGSASDDEDKHMSKCPLHRGCGGRVARRAYINDDDHVVAESDASVCLECDKEFPDTISEEEIRKAGWEFGGDAPGFWFHKETWGSWKAAASWAGTDNAPDGEAAKPDIYDTLDLLVEGEDDL